MSTIRATAERFFDACETGQGWEVCRRYAHPDATFSAQARALEGVESLEAYAEWMKAQYGPMPDAGYDLRAFAVDEERDTALAYAVFEGTHTGEGGPVPPTGRSVEADYVYAMEFDDGKVRHVTKIWNDGHSMRQLGWA